MRSPNQDIFSASKDLVDAWRRYPALAARDLLYNPISETETDWFSLSPIQRVVINRIWRARNSINVACRGFGKTFGAATLATLTALLYPGRRVGCMSASFRQSKQIFEEITQIWSRSPLLQACTERAPIISNDSCRLVFKAVSGHNPSVIIGLPLADGARIRGNRMHTLILDEANIIPEDTFQTVLRPFGASALEPTKQVRIIKEKKRILASNFSDEKKAQLLSFLDKGSGANQIHMFLSGYFSFNWVYGLYCKYSDRMHGIRRPDSDGLDETYTDNPMDYATFQIPYWSLEEGWLVKAGIEDAKRDMSSLQFRMEYEAAWISDSGGFFKASDVDKCKDNSLKILSSGLPGKTYIMAFDTARVNDAMAIVIAEYDLHAGMKVVRAEQYFGKDAFTPDMVERLFELARLFNPIHIVADAGGGGLQIIDYLAKGLTSKDGTNYAPIFDMDDESYRGQKGRHILQKIDFSPTWLDDAHQYAYGMLQKREIAFPTISMEGDSSDKALNAKHTDYQTIVQMMNQIISIEPSETRTGRTHYDLPKTGGGFVRHKDLYSAWLMLCFVTYTMTKKLLGPVKRMPLMGIITPRGGSYGMW
jgi:hypothetical protein